MIKRIILVAIIFTVDFLLSSIHYVLSRHLGLGKPIAYDFMGLLLALVLLVNFVTIEIYKHLFEKKLSFTKEVIINFLVFELFCLFLPLPRIIFYLIK